LKPSPTLFLDTVDVEEYLGESAYGPLFATSVTVSCRVSATRQLVRNSLGEEVVSEATLYVQPADATPFVPESRATISGRASLVLGVSPQGRPGETSFIKVTCS
jgi:hypothetical protein